MYNKLKWCKIISNMTISSISKKHLIILGILPVTEQHFPFKLRKYQSLLNRIHVIFVFAMLIGYASTAQSFIWFKAQTFAEYFAVLFFLVVTTFHIALYTALIWKRSNLSQFIDDVENVMDESKFISIECILNWLEYLFIELYYELYLFFLIFLFWNPEEIARKAKLIVFFSGIQNPIVCFFYLENIEKAEIFARTLWNTNVVFIQLFAFSNILMSFFFYFTSDYSGD